MTRERKNALFVAIAGCLMGFVAFGTLGSVFVWGERTPGTVIDEKRSSQGTCSPVLEYKAAGRVQRAGPRVQYSSDCGWIRGEPVTVYYWPGSPSSPWLLSFASVFVPSLLPTSLLVIALFMAQRARARSATARKRPPG